MGDSDVADGGSIVRGTDRERKSERKKRKRDGERKREIGNEARGCYWNNYPPRRFISLRVRRQMKIPKDNGNTND